VVRNYFWLYPNNVQEEKLNTTVETYTCLYFHSSSYIKPKENIQFMLTELTVYEPLLKNSHNKMLKIVVDKLYSIRKALKVFGISGHNTD